MPAWSNTASPVRRTHRPSGKPYPANYSKWLEAVEVCRVHLGIPERGSAASRARLLSASLRAVSNDRLKAWPMPRLLAGSLGNLQAYTFSPAGQPRDAGEKILGNRTAFAAERIGTLPHAISTILLTICRTSLVRQDWSLAPCTIYCRDFRETGECILKQIAFHSGEILITRGC